MHEKLTRKLQQALVVAQQDALANDNPAIEPAHLLAALLADEESGATAICGQAGADIDLLQREVRRKSRACRAWANPAAKSRFRANCRA